MAEQERDEQGRFAVTLKQPGRVTLGYAFLQRGDWGRFKGLPVRKELAEALLAQGIRVLRFNGGMIEVPGYRWRNLRGPRDERAPYDGFYDRYCSSGFGPLEAVAFGSGRAKVHIEKAPEFSIGGLEYGPYEDMDVHLPTCAALYLILKRLAWITT